jgi:hypothetical protein
MDGFRIAAASGADLADIARIGEFFRLSVYSANGYCKLILNAIRGQAARRLARRVAEHLDYAGLIKSKAPSVGRQKVQS